MNSKEMNQLIRYYETNAFKLLEVKGLEGTDKALPYAGWYWRDVDFDSDIMKLAHVEGLWWGFDAAGRWIFATYKCKPEEIKQIKSLVIQAILDPVESKLQQVFDYLQKIPKSTSVSVNNNNTK